MLNDLPESVREIAEVIGREDALKLAVATNPIGLVLMGLATAAVLIYKN